MTNVNNAPVAMAAQGHNSQKAKEEWLKKCREFGATTGSAEASKIGMMEDIVTRSKNGDIVPDDAPDGFNAWQEARIKMLGPVRGRPMKKSVQQARISEIKRMIQFGSLPNVNAPKLFGTVLRVVRENASITGEVDDKLLKVARVQCGQPDTPLTEAEIKQVLTEQLQAAEATEVEEMGKERKRLNKIGETFGFNAHLRAAINSVNARIEQLGGTGEDKRAADKAKREAEKKARAKAKAKSKRV